MLVLVWFAFSCDRSVETLDFCELVTGGIRVPCGPCWRLIMYSYPGLVGRALAQVEFRGLRSGWDQVGAKSGCQAGAGWRCSNLYRLLPINTSRCHLGLVPVRRGARNAHRVRIQNKWKIVLLTLVASRGGTPTYILHSDKT